VSSDEPAIFRVGSRYPILTSLSTSSTSDAVATELAAAGVSSAAIAKYGGSTSTTSVPQIQFEDLGLTLKVTPTIADNNKVRLALDFKIEAIGGTGIDGIPILNSRAMASTVTVLAGETTMLATLVSTNETKLLNGVPDLNDLPGFQSTDRNTDGSKNELLITVTPHIVHTGLMRVTDHRLVTPHSGTGGTISPAAR
jgi:type II secretory pathway component GspD/PulD (secretin)